MCLDQNISIGSIHASFHHFHNVSTYVKWPQKLVTHVLSIIIATNSKNVMTLKVIYSYPKVISWYIMSCRVTPYHVTSYLFIYQQVLTHHVLSYFVMPYHVISCHVLLIAHSEKYFLHVLFLFTMSCGFQ